MVLELPTVRESQGGEDLKDILGRRTFGLLPKEEYLVQLCCSLPKLF